jgi:hypothetical protein
VVDHGMSDNGQIAALESLRLAGLDHAAGGDGGTPRAGKLVLGTVHATRAAVVDERDIKLTLSFADEIVADIALGAADVVALASDLLTAARRRLGRGGLAD